MYCQVSQAQPQLVTCCGQFAKDEFCRWVNVPQHTDVPDARQRFFQQRKPLPTDFARDRHQAGHVAARSSETLDEMGPGRVATCTEEMGGVVVTLLAATAAGVLTVTITSTLGSTSCRASP